MATAVGRHAARLHRDRRAAPRGGGAGKLVAALDALDYPRAKLDNKLVIEEGDDETREALERLDLPLRYQIVVAPDGQPRTKPRALNIALAQAETTSSPCTTPRTSPSPTSCARRRPRSPPCRARRMPAGAARHRQFRDSWLARLFAIEYAALFEAVNPGLSRLDAPVALGGTLNHFRIEALRDAGGWDTWNVTEDIDLGFRLARHGYGVDALDSKPTRKRRRGLPPG